MFWIKAVSVILIGYLLGSVNTSILVGKCYGVEIRAKGSGNAGATNTLRVLGKGPGVIVFLGDFLKGLLSCTIAWLVVPEAPMVAALAGLGAVVGHNFPVYFGFKGGKGIATTMGVMMFLDYRVALGLMLAALLFIFITRYVSLSVLIGFAMLPFAMYFVTSNWGYAAVTLVMTVLAFYTHRQNISRLAHGTENKIGSKKKEQ